MEQAHTPSICAQHRLVLLRETRVHRAACAVTTSSCRCHSQLCQWVRRRSTQLTALLQQQLLQAHCAPNLAGTYSHNLCCPFQAMALQWCYALLSGVHAVLHHTGASCRTHLGAVDGPADRHHSHPLPAAGVCTGGQASRDGRACAIVHACPVSGQSRSRACHLSSSRHRLYAGRRSRHALPYLCAVQQNPAFCLLMLVLGTCRVEVGAGTQRLLLVSSRARDPGQQQLQLGGPAPGCWKGTQFRAPVPRCQRLACPDCAAAGMRPVLQCAHSAVQRSTPVRYPYCTARLTSETPWIHTVYGWWSYGPWCDACSITCCCCCWCRRYMQIHPGHAICEGRKPALMDSLFQVRGRWVHRVP